MHCGESLDLARLRVSPAVAGCEGSRRTNAAARTPPRRVALQGTLTAPGNHAKEGGVSFPGISSFKHAVDGAIHKIFEKNLGILLFKPESSFYNDPYL